MGKEESMSLGTTYIFCDNCKCPIFYGENCCPDCMRPVGYPQKKNVETMRETKKRFDLRFWKRFKQ